MRKVFTLAKKGIGFVSPNPLVGAIILKNEKKIGSGFHQFFGGKHAEINAVYDAEKNGNSVANADIFVNLEPCNNIGKTGSCAEFLLKKKIGRVFFSNFDNNPKMSGGADFLSKNGVQIFPNILEKQGKNLNKFFFHRLEKKRPFFLGKIATSLNGMISEKYDQKTQISDQSSQKFTHFLRQKYDGILVGANTVKIDNPKLSVRFFSKKKRDPLRILFDPHGKISQQKEKFIFFRDENFLVFSAEKKLKTIFSTKNLEILGNKNGFFDLKKIAKILFDRNLASVLVEGGGKTITSFLNENLLDEMIFLISNKIFAQKIATPLFQETVKFPLSLKKIKKFENDAALFFVKK